MCGGDTHTHTQTDRHINTMTQPGLGVGQSKNPRDTKNYKRYLKVEEVPKGPRGT